MDLTLVNQSVGDLPWMRFADAQYVAEFLQRHRLRRVLEFGHMHGVSTCYLAAAVDDLDGNVVTVDIPQALEQKPNLEELLLRTGLKARVTIRRHRGGAAWEMLAMLESNPRPQFDFVYVDADHSWAGTAIQFYLVDNLLVPGGWILFDDLNYTIEAASCSNSSWARSLTQEERHTRQVGKVWELLVRPHPNYDRFIERGNWGFAHKRS